MKLLALDVLHDYVHLIPELIFKNANVLWDVAVLKFYAKIELVDLGSPFFLIGFTVDFDSQAIFLVFVKTVKALKNAGIQPLSYFFTYIIGNCKAEGQLRRM